MSSREDSELARLQQLLREADQRAQKAVERAEQERRRAEDERRIRIAEEKKTRSTTFEEYICTCHTLLSKPLRIQTDKSLIKRDHPIPQSATQDTYEPVTVGSEQGLDIKQ
jgi:hypothetical protein